MHGFNARAGVGLRPVGPMGGGAASMQGFNVHVWVFRGRRAWHHCRFFFKPAVLFLRSSKYNHQIVLKPASAGVCGWGGEIDFFSSTSNSFPRLVICTIIPMSAMMYCLWACGRMVCVMVTALWVLCELAYLLVQWWSCCVPLPFFDCPMALGHTKLDPRFLVCLPTHTVGNSLKPFGIERLEL